MAMAFPPLPSMAFTTSVAELESFAYVIATLAPSEARRFAMAAPMPREAPVTIANLPSSFFDIFFLLVVRRGSTCLVALFLIGLRSEERWVGQAERCLASP